ncbi:MAG: FAD-dependent oxidoreductase [Deltaproteobacteria bacterium]|nr:FAD-dependent oxidoreductase [Deltaproteobacteria bacterium]
MAEGKRICIVGGGAGGLSAAWYLAERGYKNVVVLEKSDRPGGKCDSFTHDNRTSDLGAFTLTLGYRHVLDIARRLGANLEPQPRRLGVRWDTNPPRVAGILRSLRDDYSLLQLALSGGRYLRALWRYRSVLGPPGFAGVSRNGRFPELCLPFAEWAKQYGVEPLIEVFRLPVTDMGYGHVRQVPAAFVLEYMNFLNVLTITLYVLGLAFGWPKRLHDGFGRLWERVAWRLDVRLCTDIENITRGSEITVTWSENCLGEDGTTQRATRTQTFDHLILACPPQVTKTFLDWSADEQQLYEQIKYNDYYITVCEVAGLPLETLDALHGLEPGHPWQIMRPWPHDDVAVFYTSGESDADKILRNIRSDIARVFPAARVGQVLQHVNWAYFPHASDDALAAGYYDALEALQGQRATYVVGGLPAFETVEHVVRYSHALVERFFPRA